MKSKKSFWIYIFLAFGLSLFSLPGQIFPEEALSENIFDDEDFLGLFDLPDDDDDSDIEIFRLPVLDDISLWRKTAGFRERDPLFLLPCRRSVDTSAVDTSAVDTSAAPDRGGLSTHFFYNHTNRLGVRPYAVLNDKAVDLLVKFGTPGESLDSGEAQNYGELLRLLPFLEQMTVQARKIGGLIRGAIKSGRWTFALETLLMLTERNFWVENRGVRKQLLRVLDEYGGTSQAVRMKFGLGDTKLKVAYDLYKNDWADLLLGLSLTVPTSQFFQKDPRAIATTQVGDTRKKLLNDLLNMNRHLMLEPSFGTGHWGVGGFLDGKINLVGGKKSDVKLDAWGRVSYDHLFDTTKYRFMPSKNKLSLTTLSSLLSSETIPSGFPVNDLFPYLTRATISPGDIFNAAVGLNLNFFTNFDFCVGYDFYYQSAEKIKKITSSNIDSSLLALNESIASSISQQKVFGQISYTKKGKSFDWDLGFGGDISFASRGAAKDWTAFLKIGIKF